MATYPPPSYTEPLPIFNPIYYGNDSEEITIAYLNSHYLRFPVAQNTETLQDTITNGIAQFNDRIELRDTTPSGANTESFVGGNSNNNNRMAIIFNAGNLAYNDLTQTNDNLIVFGDVGLAPTALTIAPWSATTCGLRMTENSTLLGSGDNIGNLPLNYIKTDTTKILYNSATNQMTGNLTFTNSNSANRQISASYYNVNDITANLTGTQLYQNTTTCIFDNNYSTSGRFLFAVNDSAGVQQTPFEIYSTSVQSNKNLLINGVGNYLQFPDGTQQTTAGSPPKTYSVEYTTAGTTTLSPLPTNCIGIGVRCVGRGGNAGSSIDGNAGSWASGGTGGGGSSVVSNGIIPLIAGSVLTLTINNTAGTGFVELVFNSVSLCKAFNGNNGGNATSSSVAGVGATLQANGSGNTNFGSWNVLSGNAGVAGIPNNSFQSIAGVPTIPSTSFSSSPTYLPFSDTGRGCGQRYSASGGANQYPVASATPQGGICIITYYLK